MSFTFSQTNDTVLYEERIPALLRGFIASVGIVMIAASYVFVEIIAKTGTLDTPAKIGGLLASIVGITAFVLFGGFLFKIALFASGQTVLFDKKIGQIVYTSRAPLSLCKQKTYPMSTVFQVEITEYVHDDSSPTFEVTLSLATGDTIRMGSFNLRSEAVPQLRQIQQCVGHIPRFAND